MEKTEINTKSNRWGILMSITMIIALLFVYYPAMRRFILPAIVVIIVSGLMAWREVRRLGWPTYEKSSREAEG